MFCIGYIGESQDLTNPKILRLSCLKVPFLFFFAMHLNGAMLAEPRERPNVPVSWSIKEWFSKNGLASTAFGPAAAVQNPPGKLS